MRKNPAWQNFFKQLTKSDKNVEKQDGFAKKSCYN